MCYLIFQRIWTLLDIIFHGKETFQTEDRRAYQRICIQAKARTPSAINADRNYQFDFRLIMQTSESKFHRRFLKLTILICLLFCGLQLNLLPRNYGNVRQALQTYAGIGNLYTNETPQSAVFSRQVHEANIFSFTPRHGHEGHNGFAAAVLARNACASKNIKPGTYTAPTRLHYIANKRVVFCPVEKVGTTFWRRVFYMLTAPDRAKYRNPYDVPIESALEKDKNLFSPVGKAANDLKDGSFSFMFVRNPYSRLLSAYIDKLVPPNPIYWKVFGSPAVSAYRKKEIPQQLFKSKHRSRIRRLVVPGHDVTFAEFVKYVITAEKSSRTPDPHVMSVKRGCQPCVAKFNYIGKMESFGEDAFYVMNKLGLNFTGKTFRDTFENLTTDDAITDSIRSSYGWKKDILKYISWDKALQRIWLKLQMRGIIEFDIKLKLTPTEVHNVNVSEFIAMAREAHKKSDPKTLEKQKSDVKKEAFASVFLTDLKTFRDLFREDFILFGYDPSPSKYFQRGDEPIAPSVYFSCSHLN